MSKIGNFIAEKRKKTGMSSRNLAKITDISHNTISQIESGERPFPSPLHLKSISEALGLNLIHLYQLSGYLDESDSEGPLLDVSNLNVPELEKVNKFIEKIINSRMKEGQKMEKEKTLKVASLFAGIGGICYGFKQAGAEIIWANEIDKDACITYRHNFGDDYLVEDDIKNVDPNDIHDIDILNGGFPCQAFSIAGYQKGFDDERGNLFFEITRILKVKRPRAILLENVKNLESHDKGNTFKVIKSELEKLGYHVHHKVLNTMDYGNIPQNRERIYIVGFLSEKAYDAFQYPERINLTKTIHDVIDFGDKKPTAYYYNNSKYYPQLTPIMKSEDTIYQWRRVYCRENKSKVCPTLTANMGTGGHNVPLIKDNYDIRKLTPEECVAFQGFPEEFKFPSTISNASKYKQAGNSVSVPVVRRIVENMIKALDVE